MLRRGAPARTYTTYIKSPLDASEPILHATCMRTYIATALRTPEPAATSGER